MSQENVEIVRGVYLASDGAYIPVFRDAHIHPNALAHRGADLRDKQKSEMTAIDLGRTQS
jgi:hypothetical protein